MEQIPAVLTLRSRLIGQGKPRISATNRPRPAAGSSGISFADTDDQRTGETAPRTPTAAASAAAAQKPMPTARVDPHAEMPEQPLPDALFIHRDDALNQHSGRQCLFSGKIPARLPRVLLRVFNDPPNDGE